MGMGKSRVCGISTGARCAPLQRGRNRNGEMRLQRWAASLQRLDAFATDGCIAVPRRDARRDIGATAKPLYPIDGKAAGFDRRNPLNPRQGLKQVHFIFLAWNDSFCAEPMI